MPFFCSKCVDCNDHRKIICNRKDSKDDEGDFSVFFYDCSNYSCNVLSVLQHSRKNHNSNTPSPQIENREGKGKEKASERYPAHWHSKGYYQRASWREYASK